MDLQHVHIFILNPMKPVDNTKLGIKCEHVNMLKIQNVWNWSDTFAFILSKQRPDLVSAHAQNFFSWNLAKITLQGNANCSVPKTVTGVITVGNGRYLPYSKTCGNASMWIYMCCRFKVKVKITKMEAYLRTQKNHFLQNILPELLILGI